MGQDPIGRGILVEVVEWLARYRAEAVLVLA
jgi:hypothetical protein